jgi:hypothetical protein
MQDALTCPGFLSHKNRVDEAQKAKNRNESRVGRAR